MQTGWTAGIQGEGSGSLRTAVGSGQLEGDSHRTWRKRVGRAGPQSSSYTGGSPPSGQKEGIDGSTPGKTNSPVNPGGRNPH